MRVQQHDYVIIKCSVSALFEWISLWCWDQQICQESRKKMKQDLTRKLLCNRKLMLHSWESCSNQAKKDNYSQDTKSQLMVQMLWICCCCKTEWEPFHHTPSGAPLCVQAGLNVSSSNRKVVYLISKKRRLTYIRIQDKSLMFFFFTSYWKGSI